MSGRARGGKPRGRFHVQIIKSRLLSNDLVNRLNDYEHQFPAHELIAVCVAQPPGPLGVTVIYEVIWRAPAK